MRIIDDKTYCNSQTEEMVVCTGAHDNHLILQSGLSENSTKSCCEFSIIESFEEEYGGLYAYPGNENADFRASSELLAPIASEVVDTVYFEQSEEEDMFFLD